MKDNPKQTIKAIGETIGTILTLLLFALLFALLFWLFLVATPDQFSAECEILRAEMEAKQ